METVAKEDSKVRALVEEEVAGVPEFFLAPAVDDFLIFPEVEDDRPLALALLSLHLLLDVMKKDVIVVLCFKQNQLKNMKSCSGIST